MKHSQNIIDGKNKIKNNFLRDANIKDVPQIVSINTQCRQNNYKWIIDQQYLDNIDLNKRISKREEYFKKWDTFYLVKEVDWKVVWFIDWVINTSKEFPYDFEIKWLYIDTDYQWMWIWKELFDALVNDKRFKNYKSFYLFTLKDNPQSRWFYEKLWGKVFTEIDKDFGWKSYKLVWYYWQR